MVHRSSTRRVLRNTGFALLAGVLTLGTGCAHIPQRAIDNGRAMTTSLQYQRFMAGERNIGTFRSLYYRANARQMYQRDLPYPLFGNW